MTITGGPRCTLDFDEDAAILDLHRVHLDVLNQGFAHRLPVADIETSLMKGALNLMTFNKSIRELPGTVRAHVLGDVILPVHLKHGVGLTIRLHPKRPGRHCRRLEEHGRDAAVEEQPGERETRVRLECAPDADPRTA